jgi:hypothetical protein
MVPACRVVLETYWGVRPPARRRALRRFLVYAPGLKELANP